MSGRWAKKRAMEAARLRGSPDRLCQADLDCAVSFHGALPRIDDATRSRFRACVQEQLKTVVAERGIAPEDLERDHVLRSLGRVAARRALVKSHILTIKGREYRHRLQGSAA